MPMDPELKAYLEDMRQGLTDHAEQLNRETRAHAEQLNRDTRAHAEQLNRETRILGADFHAQIQLIAEGVTTVRDQLGQIIADHEERITQLERLRMP